MTRNASLCGRAPLSRLLALPLLAAVAFPTLGQAAQPTVAPDVKIIAQLTTTQSQNHGAGNITLALGNVEQTRPAAGLAINNPARTFTRTAETELVITRTLARNAAEATADGITLQGIRTATLIDERGDTKVPAHFAGLDLSGALAAI